MSQQGMTIVSISLGRAVILGDTIVLSTKKFLGKLLHATGNVAAVGEICAITPASGKTFYIHEGSIFVNSITNTLSESRVDVENDGTDVDHLGGATAKVAEASGTNAAGAQPFKSRTTIKGDSLDGDGIKKYRLNASLMTAVDNIYGTIEGFIEDTGTNPFADFQ